MGKIIWQLCVMAFDVFAITINDNSAAMRCVLGILVAALGFCTGFAVADMV